jgi:hypothetical protein
MSLILNGTDGLSDVDGTAGTPAIRGTDANTGIFFPAADTIAFSEGGVESMRIDSAGLVGIGCTPVSNLQVNASSDVGVAMSNSSSVTSGNRGTISMFNSGTSTVGYIRFGAVTDNVGTDIQFANRPVGGSLTEQMRITSAGLLQFNSGYGSVATAFGCRAWVNFNGTGTPAIRASGNVTSITDNGTGDYTVNFTTAMPDTNYCNVFTAGRGDSNDVRVAQPTNPLVGSLQFVTRAGTQGASTNAKEDMENIFVAVFR